MTGQAVTGTFSCRPSWDFVSYMTNADGVISLDIQLRTH